MSHAACTYCTMNDRFAPSGNTTFTSSPATCSPRQVALFFSAACGVAAAYN